MNISLRPDILLILKRIKSDHDGFIAIPLDSLPPELSRVCVNVFCTDVSRQLFKLAFKTDGGTVSTNTLTEIEALEILERISIGEVFLK